MIKEQQPQRRKRWENRGAQHGKLSGKKAADNSRCQKRGMSALREGLTKGFRTGGGQGAGPQKKGISSSKEEMLEAKRGPELRRTCSKARG